MIDLLKIITWSISCITVCSSTGVWFFKSKQIIDLWLSIFKQKCKNLNFFNAVQAGARMPRVLVIKSKQLLCNVWVYHHNPPPEYPGHFYSKRITFYFDVVVRIFFHGYWRSIFLCHKTISKLPKEFLRFGKKRESNVYFSDIGFFIRSWRPNPRLAAAGQFSPQIEKVNLFTSSTPSPPTSSPSTPSPPFHSKNHSNALD